MDDQPPALIYLDEQAELLVEELAHLRATIKDLKDREQQVRSEVLTRIGDRPVEALTADGRPAATVTVSKRRNVDRKRLEAVYPDVFEDVITESTVTTLNITQ